MPEHSQTVSSVLKKLYQEDTEDRQSKNWERATEKEIRWLKRRDKKRRNAVMFLNQLNQINTAFDYHHAAFILLHGDSPGDYALANEFAKKSVALGDESSKYLIAETEDKYQLSIGNAQKYGTQFQRNTNGEWELIEPIDESVTDKERSEYNVPPLAEAIRRYKEKIQDEI